MSTKESRHVCHKCHRKLIESKMTRYIGYRGQETTYWICWNCVQQKKYSDIHSYDQFRNIKSSQS